MKQFLLCFCTIVLFIINTNAQVYPTGIRIGYWLLDTSSKGYIDTSNYFRPGLVYTENIGAGIANANFLNGYQKITAPIAGWPSNIDTNTSIHYIEFPFSGTPVSHIDTWGGCIINPTYFKFTQIASSNIAPISFAVYVYDSLSWKTKHYYYVGSINNTGLSSTVSKTDSLFFPMDSTVFGGTKYYSSALRSEFNSALFLRIFPISGNEINIKNVDLFAGGGCLLPITFTSNKAYQKNNSNTLEWAVSDINNVQSFIIEKSIDGVSFYPVGNVNPNSSSNYIWEDKEANHKNVFYRIKAMDKNGKYKLSSAMKISGKQTTSSVVVYPNPVNERNMNIQMNNLNQGLYQINLYNLFGQNIHHSVFNYSGNSTISVSIPSTITKGTYYLEVKNESYTTNQVLSIQ